MTFRYVPQKVFSIEDVDRELLKLKNTIDSLIDGRREILYVAPSKPVAGMEVYADGTTWNPGSGAGLYRYNGSAWVFVG